MSFHSRGAEGPVQQDCVKDIGARNWLAVLPLGVWDQVHGEGVPVTAPARGQLRDVVGEARPGINCQRFIDEAVSGDDEVDVEGAI